MNANQTRRSLLALLGGAALALALPRAEAADDALVFVVNANNPVAAISADDARAIFLGDKKSWPGGAGAVVPYNRPADAGAGAAFFGGVLKMAPSRYKFHWQERELSGQGVAPDTVASVTSLAAKIAASPGAVGYALQAEVAGASGVRVVPFK